MTPRGRPSIATHWEQTKKRTFDSHFRTGRDFLNDSRQIIIIMNNICVVVAAV